MAKTTATIERALFALNPIRYRLQLDMDDWPPFSDAGNQIDVYGKDDILITYMTDEQGRLDVDVSPVVRSLLAGILSRRKVLDEVFSDYANCLRWCISNADNEKAYVPSVFGAYGRPYKDEDFDWSKGALLNCRKLTMYRGLPFSLQMCNVRHGEDASIVRRGDGKARSRYKTPKLQTVMTLVESRPDRVLLGSAGAGTVACQNQPIRVFPQTESMQWNPGRVRIEFDWECADSLPVTPVIAVTGSGVIPSNTANTIINGQSGHASVTFIPDSGKASPAYGILKFADSGHNIYVKNIRTYMEEYDTREFKNVYSGAASWTDTGGTGRKHALYGSYALGTVLLVQLDVRRTAVDTGVWNIEIDRNGLGTVGRVFAVKNTNTSRLFCVIEGDRIKSGETGDTFTISTYFGKDTSEWEASNVKVFLLSDYSVSGVVQEFNPQAGQDLQAGLYDLYNGILENWLGDALPPSGDPVAAMEVRNPCLAKLRSGQQMYVRFLNRLGGWSYYMLDVLDRKEDGKVSYSGRQRLSVQPSEGAVESSRIPVSSEVQRTVRAGRDDLSAEEMEDLAYVTSSAMVDVWDVDNECFLPVYPKSASNAWGSEDRQEMTITFEMPEGGF